MFQLIGYCLIPFILGFLCYRAAQKGDSKSKIFMIAMIVIVALASLGSLAGGDFGIAQILSIIVAAVFTVLIRKVS